MTQCKKCGKEHGMVIEDKVTGECEPIDLCYQCIFGDWKPTPIEDVVLDPNMDYGAALRKAQDEILRDMIMSSAVKPQAPDILPQEPVVD